MDVLMISGDSNFLRPGTEAYARFLLQASQVEKLEVIIWPKQFLRPLFIRGHFDVVTSQDPFWRGLFAWIAARRLHAKLNIQVHADLDAVSLIKHVLSQIILRHASSVRVVSSRIKEQVSHYTGAPVSVLPVFVDLSKFTSIQKASHPKFKKVVLWVGRLEKEKDPAYALTVFKQVHKKLPDAGLIMLGDGSLKNDLLDAARNEGIANHVEFPGWQDPASVLSQADVVLCTSPYESWGASIVEALAAGVPVVSGDVGVAKEAGAIVVPRDGFADALIAALESATRGQLRLDLPSSVEYGTNWRKTLTV